MSNPKPKVGIFGLTGCAGDQLQILNCEDQLLEIASLVDIVDWVMAKSNNDHDVHLDIAFVEGVVATQRDLDTVRAIRARTDFLVAIGTCAVFGGLPAMRNDIPREVLQKEVYNDSSDFLDTVEARPVTHFIPVDFSLPGCPNERTEFLALMRALLVGTTPELPSFPVCWECKSKDNICRVIHFDEVCCGAMTRAGCDARCPSHGVACSGCRGPLEEPHYDANVTMFANRGLSSEEIGHRMANFSAPVWMTKGLHAQAQAKEQRDDD